MKTFKWLFNQKLGIINIWQWFWYVSQTKFDPKGNKHAICNHHMSHQMWRGRNVRQEVREKKKTLNNYRQVQQGIYMKTLKYRRDELLTVVWLLWLISARDLWSVDEWQQSVIWADHVAEKPIKSRKEGLKITFKYAHFIFQRYPWKKCKNIYNILDGILSLPWSVLMKQWKCPPRNL